MVEKLFDDVVVLTHQYPYWLGPTAETYLEGELRVVAGYTKRLHVVAFEGVWPGAPLRSGVPEKMNVITLSEDDLRLEEGPLRRWYQLRSLFRRELLLDARKVDSKERLLCYTYFIRLSDRIAETAWGRLRSTCSDFGTGRTLLYSFWFNEPARAIALLDGKMRAAGMPRPALIARAHGYDCYDYRSDVGYLPCKERMAERLDAVYACSLDGKRYLSKNNPRVAGKFHVAHLGTEDYGLGPVPSGEGPLHVVTCSRAVPLKRLDRIASSLAVLDRRGIDFRWTCIGDGEALGSVKELVRDLGIEDRVAFEGALSQKDVYAFYRSTSVDVFVNASEVEGIPLSIMEALSFGVPVVATAVGGNPEIVSEGVNGRLVPRDFEDEALADAIVSFAETDAVRFRDSARAVWEKEFSLERNTDELMASAAEFLQ